MEYRTEKDALGEMKVPKGAYYGIFVARARENFQLSGLRTHRELIKALGALKLCCAKANMRLGQLDGRIGKSIAKAAGEVMRGKWDHEFPLDPFQAGAGTPNNMNANEVIANRAIEMLGGKRGDYSLVNPNNHVNMAQSSNDVIPTATRMAACSLLEDLVKELAMLEKAFAKKAAEFRGIIKAGRTHLQDAVPIMLGQEFGAYTETVRRGRERIEHASGALLELGLGGTAIGTGITAHPKFHVEAVKEIARLTGRKFHPTANRIHLTQSMDSFTDASSSLRNFAMEMVKVSNDLMLLGSGPNTGLGELALPEVEPGSSMMPGKVNPSIVEAFKSVCLQVQGSDFVIAKAAQEGNFQLNIMAPVIGHNMFFATELLTNGCKMLRLFCIGGIKANGGRIRELFESSLVTATALSPYLGYQTTAEIVKIARREKKSIRQVILEKDIVPKAHLDRLLDPVQLTAPKETDAKLAKAISENKGYRNFTGSL